MLFLFKSVSFPKCGNHFDVCSNFCQCIGCSWLLYRGKNLESFLSQILGGLFIVEDGTSTRISFLILSVCTVSKILPNLITCYVFLALLRIFRQIKTGETPFTELSSHMWRNCSRVYAVLAVLAFLSSFIFGIAGLAALLPYMMTYLFFHALELIFLYGEGLQTESDETL